MNYFKLVSVVVMLMASVSGDVTLTQSSNGAIYNTNRSLVLFMPGKNQITTDVVKSNEEGC